MVDPPSSKASIFHILSTINTTFHSHHQYPNNLNVSKNTINMSSTNQYDAPTGDVVDDDYKSRTGQSEIPVQSDGAAIESTEYDAGGDSDKQLGMLHVPCRIYLLLTLYPERDEKDAIDSDNILDERTRGATKKAGTYTEPSDEEGIDDLTGSGQDGTSAGRQ